MKRRLLSLTLAVVLALALCPPAFAATDTTDWTVKELAPWPYNEFFRTSEFSEGLAGVMIHDEMGMPLGGYIDKTGKLVIPFMPVLRGIGFSEGLAAVGVVNETGTDIKTGYIDKTGQVVVPGKYYDAWPFSCGRAVVKMDGKYGFIDKTGKEIVPCKYSYISEYRFFEDLACVELDGKGYGYVDKNGNEIVSCQYDSAKIFSEGLGCVSRGGKYGFVDKTGREVVACKYDNAENFSDGLAAVRVEPYPNTEYGYIDKNGNVVFTCEYDEACSFSDGLARVEQSDKYGFIDKTGKEVVPCKYDMAYDFSNGLGVVKVGKWPNEKYGVIDRTGKEIVSCKYDTIYNDYGEYLVVELDGKWGVLDAGGHETVPCKYDNIGNEWNWSDPEMVLVELGGKRGLVHYTGQEILPCKYDYLAPFSDGIFGAVLDGRHSIISVTPTPALSGSGTMGGGLAWEIGAGVLTVTGPLGAEDIVAAACENAAGRFLGAAVVRAGETSAKLPKGAAAAKLMWLGAGLAPKCPCVEVGPAR